MEPMYIRAETPADYSEIHRLVETAFKTAKVRDGDEQEYIDRLRLAGGYIPGLALVAQEGDRLIGQVMLTRVGLKTRDRRAVGSLLLAPLSVLLEHRKRGVGSALVREALRRAAELGFQAVFLAGDPAYYGRFGFKAAAEFGVEYTGDIPPRFVLALELVPGALGGSAFEFEKI